MADKFPEPSLGRHVNYVLGNKSAKAGEIRTSVIVLVPDVSEDDREKFPGLCNLAVFVGTEFDFPTQAGAVNMLTAVRYDASKKPGTWHWPEHLAAAPKADPKKPADPLK